MKFTRKFRARMIGVIGTIVVIIASGVLWQNGVTNAASDTAKIKQKGVSGVSDRVNEALSNTAKSTHLKSNATLPATQQSTSNGQKIAPSDWHPVGPFYFAKGIISSVHSQDVPPDVKGPIWTDVFVTIKEYVKSAAPQTQDGSLQVGGTSPILFYDLVDHGQSHLHEGDQVIVKFAEYSCPNGKIVWGSRYDDIYYKLGDRFVNNKGDAIS